jgi:hypothetical protein
LTPFHIGVNPHSLELGRWSSFQLARPGTGGEEEQSKVQEPSNKPAKAPKNIPLISNNLRKFAEIFFNRRHRFCRLNDVNFYRNPFYPNNLPPSAFSLPASPIFGETNFLSGDHAIDRNQPNPTPAANQGISRGVNS